MSVGLAKAETRCVVSDSTSATKRKHDEESQTGWTIALALGGLFGLVALSKRGARRGRKGRRKG
jgi:hypothetical protein